MKLTKEQQIELLNDSIQKLMQENSELKAKEETNTSLHNYEIECAYDKGYDDGYNTAMWG